MQEVDRRQCDGIGPRQAFASAHKNPVQDGPVNHQSCQRHGPEVEEKIPIADSRKRSNQHVLRIARNRGHAADIGPRGNGEQIRQRREFGAAGYGKHKRHHDETNNVVHQECGKHPAREHDGREKVRQLETAEDKFDAPLEEAREVETPDNQHHREKQNNRGEINEVQRLLGGDDAKCHHGDGADDRCSGPIDFEPRKFPQGKNQITGNEDDISGDEGSFGKGDCSESSHRPADYQRRGEEQAGKS